jgi:CBS domain containing-hemolysin-like protein
MLILPLILVLLLIALFSGIEIAFLSANKLRIELLKEKGSRSAAIWAGFNAEPSRFISTMLIGLNIALVIFGSLTADLISPDLIPFLPREEVPLMLIQTVVTTFLVLMFGEIIPKILFQVNADTTLLFFAYPVRYLLYLPLTPLTGLFHFLSKWIIVHVLRQEIKEGPKGFSAADLEYLVKETAAAEENTGEETDQLNSDIFEKALYLKEVKVKSCLVPRTEIVAFEISEPFSDLKQRFVESRHSRIIVYRESMDQILGYIHHFDLLNGQSDIQQLIRSILVVPESMNARDLLMQFMKEKKSMAWVVDEYGGTAGLVTLEDIMEEIFGEIEDEHDEEELTEKELAENRFLFSGRLEIDYLNDAWQLDLPVGDYETLSGLIINRHESIPAEGEEIKDPEEGFLFRIRKATGKRIDLIEVERLPKKED